MYKLDRGMEAGYVRPDWTATWSDVIQKPYSKIYTRFAQPDPMITIERSVKIIDLSFHQGEVDFKIVRGLYDGAILRAGQNLWEDTRFQENRSKAEAEGVPWGSYWYFDSRVRPQDQANKWAEVLKGNYGDLDHTADYEENYGGAYANWTNLYLFMRDQNDSYGGGFQYLTKLPDIRVPVYTGYYYWLSAGRSPQNNPESMAWFAKHPLWLAWYTNDPSVVKIPKPWNELPPSFIRWQFTAKGNGSSFCDSLNVDENWHNGNRQEYLAHYGWVDTKPEPVPASDIPMSLSWDENTTHKSGSVSWIVEAK